MRAELVWATLIAGAVGALVVQVTGCELLVQLDRSAVEAGPDTGCAICSDAFEGDGPEGDGKADAKDAGSPDATDASDEGPPGDAGSDASESGGDGASDAVTDAPGEAGTG